MWATEEHKERGTFKEFWEEQHRLNTLAAQLPESERVASYAAELKNIEGYVDVDVWRMQKRFVHGANDRIVPPTKLAPSHTLVHRNACAIALRSTGVRQPSEPIAPTF